MYISTIIQFIKLFHVELQMTSSDTTIYIYVGTEQLSECMADRQIQVFHCWSGRLQICKVRGYSNQCSNELQLELSPTELMFSLIEIQIVTYKNIYRFLYMHRLAYTHRFPFSVSCEGMEAMTCCWGVAMRIPNTQTLISNTIS